MPRVGASTRNVGALGIKHRRRISGSHSDERAPANGEDYVLRPFDVYQLLAGHAGDIISLGVPATSRTNWPAIDRRPIDPASAL